MEFTKLLTDNGTAIRMDGKGAWRDNVFIERLWKSIKYEEVYLHPYGTVSVTKKGIQLYLFYNRNRPDQGLGGIPPDAF